MRNPTGVVFHAPVAYYGRQPMSTLPMVRKSPCTVTATLNCDMDIKTILLLALVALALVAILAHREMTRPEKPPRVEYKFMNFNF